jgi:hypothetical protein
LLCRNDPVQNEDRPRLRLRPGTDGELGRLDDIGIRCAGRAKGTRGRRTTTIGLHGGGGGSGSAWTIAAASEQGNNRDQESADPHNGKKETPWRRLVAEAGKTALQLICIILMADRRLTFIIIANRLCPPSTFSDGEGNASQGMPAHR